MLYVNLNNNFISIMSNLANYSPYNKTYKFILFQNQAYHQRNKRNISPCVKTNLRHSMSRHSPNRNPQDNLESVKWLSSSGRDFSNLSMRKSEIFVHKQIKNVIVDKQKKQIHKHQSFQKFQNKKILHENMELVTRLLKTQCQIVKKDHALQSFDKHKKYQRIRMRYNQSGQRNDVLPLGQRQLLCPTLDQFHSSGLGQKFIINDLSMSVKPATSQSCRRSNLSQSRA